MDVARSVIILTHQFDPTVDKVVEELNSRGVPLFRVDTSEFPERLSVGAELRDGHWSGQLRTARRCLDLSAVSGIYYWRPTNFEFHPELSDNERRWATIQARMGLGGLLASLEPWLNHPHRIGYSEYKLVQLRAAVACGLRVPRTVVTNEPETARAFVADVGRAVYKPFGGSGVYDDDGFRQVFCTVVVDPKQCGDPNISRTMHLFQEWVPKDYEVRLTVVGGEFFAARIDAKSEAAQVDWRSEYGALTYHVVGTPDVIRSRVSALLDKLGLRFGALDFVVAPDGEWWFLEINPNGQWAWIKTKRGCPSPVPLLTPWKEPRNVTDADSLRAQFMDELTNSGTVSDPEWLAAFRDIPREAFVPYYFTQTPEQPGWLLVEHPHPEWLKEAYSIRPLITQIDGNDDNADLARTSRVDGVATSSSSAPPLMALMLEALNIHDGHRVLEVGTGTGYNAALLCHRLGAANVTSIDIDAGLVHRAGERLAALSYSPHLKATDGMAGCPDRAPFDRIIATVGIPRVPGAWIEQTTPGAKILVPLDLAGSAGLLALLTVDPDGKAEGPFLPDFGGFMPIRANQHQPNDVLSTVDDNDGDKRETTLSVDAATNTRDPFEFFAALTVGGYDWLGFIPNDGGPAETWLTQPNGSWVCHITDATGTQTVRQGGPLRLWDDIEAAHLTWQQLGQPARARFGMTVHDGRHTVWLDHPTAPHRWDLKHPSHDT